MIKLKYLIEAISPDKGEYDAAAKKSKYGNITVILSDKGVIYIDDPETYKSPIPHENTIARADLWFDKTIIRIYKAKLHGNKINPATQQLISALVKNKIIDSSWKVNFSDNEGWYRGYGDYVIRKGEFDDLPPNFWKRNSRVDIGENLTLYHGTSDLELPTILKDGLRPLGSKHTIAGPETRLRTEYNKNFLYLAGTFQDAFRFAKSKARGNMLRTNKQEYSYVEHWEWGRWFIKPVVLLIRLPDFTNLRSDDDRVISLIKAKGYELWKTLTPEQKTEQQIKSAQWFKEHEINYKSEHITDYLWTISDNGFNSVLKHIDKAEWKNWKASLGSHNQVGYEGVIPPNYITVVDLDRVVSKK